MEFPDNAEGADDAAAADLLARARGRRAGGEVELREAQAAERLDAEGLAGAEEAPVTVRDLEEAEIELVLERGAGESAVAESDEFPGAQALAVFARAAGEADFDAVAVVRRCRAMRTHLAGDVEAEAQRRDHDAAIDCLDVGLRQRGAGE